MAQPLCKRDWPVLIKLNIDLPYINISRSVMPDSATQWTIARQAPLYPWNSLGKNTRVGCHFLPQGIVQTRD